MWPGPSLGPQPRDRQQRDIDLGWPAGQQFGHAVEQLGVAGEVDRTTALHEEAERLVPARRRGGGDRRDGLARR